MHGKFRVTFDLDRWLGVLTQAFGEKWETFQPPVVGVVAHEEVNLTPFPSPFLHLTRQRKVGVLCFSKKVCVLCFSLLAIC